MPAYTYQFMRFPSEHRGYTRLPLLIRNPTTGRQIATVGLVDTGADESLFPAALAVQLGHDLKGRGVKRALTAGIEQSEIISYKHTFHIALLSPDMRRVVWKRKMEIDCVESNPPILLGVDDFLCRFKLAVNYPVEMLTLSWR